VYKLLPDGSVVTDSLEEALAWQATRRSKQHANNSIIKAENRTQTAQHQRLLNILQTAGPTGCLTQQLYESINATPSQVCRLLKPLRTSGRVRSEPEGRELRWFVVEAQP